MIHKSRIPDAAKRGHLFEMGITRLVEWWTSFFEVTPTGHLRSRIFNDVQSELIEKGLINATEDAKSKGHYQQLGDHDEYEDMEVLRSEKSLMKHALQRFGSRDVSAQLFTALCRALGIPARLVTSLQSVPWQSSIGKPRNTVPTARQDKGKGKATSVTDDEQAGEASSDMEEVPIPVHRFPGEGERLDGGSTRKGKQKAKPAIKLRPTKSKGQTLGSSQIPSTFLNLSNLKKSMQISVLLTRYAEVADPTTTPPVFWTEVFSRPDARWIPVDPIRGIVNKRKLFDPSNSNASRGSPGSRMLRVDNRMSYVIAFEEDGYARDLTPRYALEYGAKVAKTQAGGKSRKEWWDAILGAVTRPFRLVRPVANYSELRLQYSRVHYDGLASR